MLQQLLLAVALVCCSIATLVHNDDVSSDQSMTSIDVQESSSVHHRVRSLYPSITFDEVEKPFEDYVLKKSTKLRSQAFGSVQRNEIKGKEVKGDDEESNILKRTKRNLIIPGTNWCGVGNVSRDNSEVGEIVSTDKCCREHDHCPHTIGAFSTKYSLFNFRVHTISHCECDDIFRTCLRMASSTQADVMGSLFFNTLSMKCFIFKRETVCAERAWWGKCERERTKWIAEIRDPLEY